MSFWRAELNVSILEEQGRGVRTGWNERKEGKRGWERERERRKVKGRGRKGGDDRERRMRGRGETEGERRRCKGRRRMDRK